MQDSSNQPKMLSIGEAAEYLGVSIDTLRRWEKKGRVQAFRSPGNHRFFKTQDLDNLFGMRYVRDEESESDTESADTATVNSSITESSIDNGSDSAPEGLNKIQSDNSQKQKELSIPQINPISYSTPPLEPPAPPIADMYTIPQPFVPLQQPSNQNPIDEPPSQPTTIPLQTPSSATNSNPIPEMAQNDQSQIVANNLSDNERSRVNSHTELASALKESKIKNKLPLTKIIIWLVVAFTLIDLIFAFIWFSSPDMISPLP